MAALHKYAQSLSGTTILGSITVTEEDAAAKVEPEEVAKEADGGGKAGKGKKEKPVQTKADKIKERVALEIAKKSRARFEKQFKDMKEDVEEPSRALGDKLKLIDDFCARCDEEFPDLCLLACQQRLDLCMTAWRDECGNELRSMKSAVEAFVSIRTITTKYIQQLKAEAKEADSCRKAVLKAIAQLGFSDVAVSLLPTLCATKKQEDACLSDRPNWEEAALSVDCKSVPDFQLKHMGHLLPRPRPSRKDDRTRGFTPDDWQSECLDAVDRRHSAVVCAPTSAGKSFISFYCMEKVLRDSANRQGVCVFVLPTMALVNQTVAQVYASFPHDFAVVSFLVYSFLMSQFTQKYRYRMQGGLNMRKEDDKDKREREDSFRILITLPECLETMLTSAEYAIWSQRIRTCVLDEIHCISTDAAGMFVPSLC